MKYTTEINQSLIAITLLLASITVLQAQKNIQTQQDSIQVEENIMETVPSMPESRCTVPKTATRDREFDCLKGNVHTVKSEFAVFVKKDGQYVKSGVSQEQIITYDKLGNRIERLTYGNKSYGTESSVSRVIFNFNSKGIATGWEEYSPGKQIPVKSIYSFDKTGNRTKEVVTYTEFNQQAILILIYDTTGNKIEERQYYPVPVSDGKKKIKVYDEKYLTRFIRYKYDGKNLIQITNYNKEGLIIYKGISTYENGNKKEVISYSANADGELVRSNRASLVYDKKGNLIEKVIYNKDDSIKSRYINGFDDEGNMISQIIYDSNGKTKGKISVTFEFDSHGNWLSYTTDDSHSGEPYPMEIRTITYY